MLRRGSRIVSISVERASLVDPWLPRQHRNKQPAALRVGLIKDGTDMNIMYRESLKAQRTAKVSDAQEYRTMPIWIYVNYDNVKLSRQSGIQCSAAIA